MTRRQIGFVFANCLFGILAALTASAQDNTSSALTPQQKELSRKGDSQGAAKDFDGAITTYRTLLDGLTDSRDKADIWTRIGEAYRQKGDLAETLRALQRAAALVPANASIMTTIGMLYEVQQDPARARQAYERALELEPNNAIVLNNLAFLLTGNAAELEKGLGYALQAQRLMPQSLEITDTVGWLYLKKNKPADAAEQFKSAVTGAPDNPEYHYHYAMALNQQGKTAEAASECRAALDRGPRAELRESIRRECAAR